MLFTKLVIILEWYNIFGWNLKHFFSICEESQLFQLEMVFFTSVSLWKFQKCSVWNSLRLVKTGVKRKSVSQEWKKTLLIFKKGWAFQIPLWQPGLNAKLWRQPFHYLVQPGKLDNSSCTNKIRTTFIFSDINNALFSPLQTNYYSVYTSILLAPIYLLIMVPEQQNNTVWDKIKAFIDTKVKREVWKVWKSVPLK